MKSFIQTLLLLACPILALANPPLVGFESAEHIAAGDNIQLHWKHDDASETAHVFTLPNGLKLTYGQILSLGDFYGVIGQVISEGNTEEERETRFIQVFQMFANEDNAKTEVPKILAVATKDQQLLDEGMKQGQKPEDIYRKMAGDDNREWNCITGGGCLPSSWWMKQGRYLQLAQQDFDHFGENAWRAYQAGHAIAIKKAQNAYTTHDIQQLEQAYAINAFASHFLADKFASGHMRTPRTELPTAVTPRVVGSLLVGYMHKEENQFGLHVHNTRGDRWLARGDRYYYDEDNAENRRLLQEALQLSADEIFTAFDQGIDSSNNDVKKIVPIPDESASNSQIDIAPMFYWNNETKQILRRVTLSNLNDNHWTADWWGWTTFIELARERGLPTESQAELVEAGFGKKAMKYGLLTDKNIRSYYLETKL